MKSLIEGFKRFDGTDWMFFLLLGVANLFAVFIVTVAAIAGAPVALVVIFGAACVGNIWGYLNATRYAMGY